MFLKENNENQKTMDIKELRIGNYVKSLNTVCTIDCIFRQQVEVSNNYEDWTPDLEDIKPIPLTEDWLLKFGYELWETVIENDYEKYKRYIHHNLLGTSNHEVHIIHSTYGDTDYTEYVTSIDKDERQYNWRMDYVHDLQNAVYKETGLELTISNENQN